MLHDLRIAARTLSKAPGFAVTAVAALALGIGANTAIFSTINSLMLNPAGISDPGGVVAIRVKYDKLNMKSISVSLTDFDDIRKASHLFKSAAVQSGSDYSFLADGVPERLMGAQVTHQWFDVFGAKPLHGRLFRVEEDQPKTNYVVVLAYPAWKKYFGGQASAIGKKINLNRELYEVVGVMPPEFRMPVTADFFTPLGLPAESFGPRNRFNESYSVFARLQPGVTFEQANAAVKATSMNNLTPDQRNYAQASDWGMFAIPFTDFTVGPMRTPLLILMGAVGFVLLIACSNIAGLLLARTSERAREIAVRAALGAGRWRLVRQGMAESVILAVAGALAGLALGFGGLRLLVAATPEQLYAERVLKLDPMVLGFTALAAMLSAILFGLLPAWQLSRFAGYDTLKDGGRSGSAGVGRQKTRSALVIIEVALALILLVGAGLLLRSFANIQKINPGFDPAGVMTAELRIPRASGPTTPDDEDRMFAFHRQLIEKLKAIPGTSNAAMAYPLPFSGNDGSSSFAIQGRVQGPGDPGPHSRIRYISPDYFAAMKVPIIRGRTFNDQDRKSTEPVTVIDENLARQYWPNEEPIGQYLARRAGPIRIIGVVGNVKQTDMAADSNKGIRYLSIYQTALPFGGYVVRTSGDPLQLSSGIRAAVQAVDPIQPVHNLDSMETRINAALAPRRFAMVLLGVFAGLALFMAALGLYGVISYSVGQRTQEIGIRMALGAQQGQVLGMVLSHGLRLVGIGVAIGLAAAALLARSLATQLYQLSPFDPVTFSLTAGVLAVVALLASVLPARRATRIDPIEALRYQ